MNELAIHRPPGAMADIVPPDHVRTVEAVLANGLVQLGREWGLEVLPTVQQRGRLNERAKDVRSLLRPFSESTGAAFRVAADLTDMLGAWVNLKGMSAEDKQSVVTGYCKILGDLPGWAVSMVCTEFQEGRAVEIVDGKEKRLSPDFAPSAPRIHMLARAKLDDLHAEAALIQRLMTAKLASPVPAPEEQNRVAEMMKDVAANWAKKVADEDARDAERRRAAANEAEQRAREFHLQADRRRLARYAALGLKPVYVGSVLCDADALPGNLQVLVDDGDGQ